MTRSKSEILAGGGIVIVLAAASILAPVLAAHDPVALSLGERLASPGGGHPFGTDELGRDVLARILFGARSSLLVASAAALLSTSIGLAVAAVAANAGKLVESVIFRLADVLLAFPGALLAVALAALLGPGRGKLVVALAATGWIGVARLSRSQIMKWRNEPFVAAAESAGATKGRIFFRHLLPQLVPLVVITGTLQLSGFVLSEGALSFLGLGIPPPDPSWGGMIDAARGHLLDAPYLTMFPAGALVLTMIGLALLGDGLVSRWGGER